MRVVGTTRVTPELGLLEEPLFAQPVALRRRHVQTADRLHRVDLGTAALARERVAHARRRYRWLLAVVPFAVLAACGGSSTSAVVTGTSTTTTDVTEPTGFGSIGVRLTEPDGTTCERCLLLAHTAAERERGLMAVTSIGDHDGMAFVYDEPRSGQFWMKDTVLPLSIGFYDAAGAQLAAFDMDPCTTPDAQCATYGPNGPFTVAVETEQGRLAELGFTPTATLELLAEGCVWSGAGEAA